MLPKGKGRTILIAVGLTIALAQKGMEVLSNPKKKKPTPRPAKQQAPQTSTSKSMVKKTKPEPKEPVDKKKLSRHEQYEKYGYWSGYVGGGFATSTKDPDDWEHPYTK